MQSQAIRAPEPTLAHAPGAPRAPAHRVRHWTDDNALLLQRTQALVHAAPADPQYGTAFDYFMLEREARALRRAYLGDVIALAWKRACERVAALRGPMPGARQEPSA